MIRILQPVVRRLATVLAAALVLMAVVVTLVRLGLPLAGQMRDDLAVVLSERLGYPVRIEQLTLRLSGWTPRLVMDRVSVGEGPDGGGLLAVRTMELDLDLLASLRDRSPRLGALTLVGPRLALRRLASGCVRISGLDRSTSTDTAVLERFLDQGQLNLIDADLLLVDDDSGLPLARFDELRLRMRNAGARHRLVAFARLLPPAGSQGVEADAAASARLRLIADLVGPGAAPATWDGTLYTSLQGMDLDALVPSIWRSGRLPRSGSVLLESWVQVAAGRPSEVLARIALRGMELPLAAVGVQATPGGSVDGRLRVDGLTGTLRAVARESGWSLGARQLELSVDGRELPGLSLDVDLASSGRLGRLALVAEPFDLGHADELLRATAQVLPAPLERLILLRPRGRVDGLSLALERPQEGPRRWRLATRVSALALNRSGHIPGVNGLDLLVRADQDGGELGLGSEALDLDLAPLFDAPLHFDRLSGRLSWSIESDGTSRIEVPELVVRNADLSGRACLGLELPGSGESPVIDLRASFQDGDGSRARAYLPVGKMHPKLVRWLERAVVDGWVPRAQLRLEGPLERYPFRDDEGRFELTLEVEDVELDYREGWPPLRDAAGTLRFVNEGMEIELTAGSILGSDVRRAHATLADRKHSRSLPIHAETEGPLADGLRILAETPLSQRLGPVARVLEADGDSRLDLDLAVPLKKDEHLGVEGRVHWSGSAQVGLRGTPVALDHLNGELAFTARSISANAVEARLWGQPVTLSVKTPSPGDAGVSRTRIHARGRLPVKLLAERFRSPVWTLAEGSLDLDLGVQLRNADLGRADLPIDFDLRSDLSGLVLDLPAPLGKAAGAARAMRLRGTLVPHRSAAVSGSVGDLGLVLGMDLSSTLPTLGRARLHLGGGEDSPAPGHRGVLVDGRVPVLVLEDWMQWWRRVGPGLGGSAPDPLSSGSLPIETDLIVDRLDIGSLTLHDAQIQAASAQSGWTVGVDAVELDGRLAIPAGEGTRPLDLALGRLDLASLVAEDRNGAATPSSEAGGAAIALPAMDLNVNDLRWGDATLGRLDLKLRRHGREVDVPTLVFSGIGGTRINGSAHWSEAGSGAAAGMGQLSLEVEVADSAPLLKALDDADAIDGAPVWAGVDISWPGGLAGLSLRRASGTITVRTGAGRLLEVEPGVGRLLGFLNLGALSRRLSLDFSDLYAEGFAFEYIDGKIAVGGGEAILERFEIDGPAGVIRATGSTDLEDRTFDQVVTVEPRIGTGVALAGAVAGGPVVGAAVFLVDKASGGAFDRLASYRYRVTGPWTQPRLTRMGWDPFRANGGAAGDRAFDEDRARAFDAAEPKETNFFLE